METPVLINHYLMEMGLQKRPDSKEYVLLTLWQKFKIKYLSNQIQGAIDNYCDRISLLKLQTIICALFPYISPSTIT